MALLSALTRAQEARFGIRLPWCSGGNSANLPWLAAGGVPGRINHLRLGEALLLGRDPLSRAPIPGQHTDAITLVAEVIESKRKPRQPWGTRQRTSFDHRRATAGPPRAGEAPLAPPSLQTQRAILCLGEQDADPGSLSADGLTIEGASSDHLIVTGERMELAVGDEQRFQIGYSSLLRAMTSPKRRLTTAWAASKPASSCTAPSKASSASASSEARWAPPLRASPSDMRNTSGRPS